MINIYVVNLYKYTCGKDSGQWITLPMKEEELKEKIKKILGNNEECAIHDYEIQGKLEFEISEYENIFDLNNLADELINLTEHDINKINAIIEAEQSENIRQALSKIENFSLDDSILNEKDYGHELFQEHYINRFSDNKKFKDALENLECYIDFEEMGETALINYEAHLTQYGLLTEC